MEHHIYIKKRFKSLPLVLALCLAGLGLTACSGSDDAAGGVADVVESGAEYDYFDGFFYYKITSEDALTACVCGGEDGRENVDVPSSVSIGGHEYAVTAIGDNAFSHTVMMTRLTLPATVTAVGYKAFDHCLALEEIVMPEGLSEMGAYAFAHCTALAEVELPAGLRTVGEGAFYNCYSLASVSLPEGFNAIGSRMFQYCIALTAVELPAGVTDVGDYAFDGCSSLVSADLPEGIVRIGYSAFGECTSLASADLPDGLTEIGGCAFTECTSLTSVVIPDGVTRIGERAFYRNEKLKSVTVPNSLTVMENAFELCKLTEVRSRIEDPQAVSFGDAFSSYFCYEDNIIYDGTKSCRLYVPKGTAAKYATYKGKKFVSITEVDYSNQN